MLLLDSRTFLVCFGFFLLGNLVGVFRSHDLFNVAIVVLPSVVGFASQFFFRYLSLAILSTFANTSFVINFFTRRKYSLCP